MKAKFAANAATGMSELQEHACRVSKSDLPMKRRSRTIHCAGVRMLRSIFCALALFTLGACNGASGHQDDQTLQSIVNDTREGRTEAVYERLDPSIQTPETQAVLAQLTTILRDAGEPCERSLINVTTLSPFNDPRGPGREVIARHLYTCPNATLAIDITVWAPESGAHTIRNFRINGVDPRAAVANAEFSLKDQSVRHYAFFAAAIFSLVLMLMAFIGVIFTKGFKRKWLWAILSFVGVTKVAMIWPTGVIVTQFLTINLIGFGVTRGADPTAPWIVNFTPPIGAILVLSLLWPRWAGLSKGDELANPRS